jgi:amino acid transporter
MAIIVGIVIGAGIFRTPSLVAANAGDSRTLLLAWTLGGAISLVGALCYAELATTYQHAGGDYHFLTRAFGNRLSFLFAWARLSVIQTGSIALLAFIFGDYASQLLSLGPHSSPLYAGLVVILLTALNILGVRQGKRVQNLLTTLEVLGVLVVIAAALAANTPSPGALTAATSAPRPGSLGMMMVFVLLTYGGWNEAAYVSAELRGARRNMARALIWSILLITSLYLLINWAYLRGLGIDGMSGSEAVAADLMRRAAGERGAQLVSLMVAVSSITSANATVFTGARTNFALGRDFAPLAFLGRWDKKADTPFNALLVQGAITLLLILFGALTRNGFETIVDYTAPVFWLFFLLAGASLFVLRAKDPETKRPFRVPFYPVTPLLFCVTCSFLLYSSLAYTGVGALVGVAVLGAGALFFQLARSFSSEQTADYS